MGANKKQTPDPKGGRQMNTPVGKSTCKCFDNTPNLCTYLPTLIISTLSSKKQYCTCERQQWIRRRRWYSGAKSTTKRTEGKTSQGGQWGSLFFLVFLLVFLCRQASGTLAAMRRWGGVVDAKEVASLTFRSFDISQFPNTYQSIPFIISVHPIYHISHINKPYQSVFFPYQSAHISQTSFWYQSINFDWYGFWLIWGPSREPPFLYQSTPILYQSAKFWLICILTLTDMVFQNSISVQKKSISVKKTPYQSP